MAEPGRGSDATGVRRLVLVRHGQTAWNLEGRAQGHTDVSLDATGRAQARAMAAYVGAMSPTALWCSDLARARETAAYVETATGLTARPDARLREFDVGLRAGLTVAEFARRFPDEHAVWAAGHVTGGVPGSETTAEVTGRMVPVLRAVLAATAVGETSVVVTHGAALRVSLAALLGWPDGLDLTLRAMDNCGWSTVEEEPSRGRPRLASYNETAHPGVHTPDFASDAPVG
ncbi:MAG TPA: histidine phosphatase family protein [Marmoricola sp.]